MPVSNFRSFLFVQSANLMHCLLYISPFFHLICNLLASPSLPSQNISVIFLAQSVLRVNDTC